MSKFVKDLITKDLRNRLEGVNDALLIDVIGLENNKNCALRQRLRKKNIELLVVKNSLARRATEGTSLAPAFEATQGTMALIWGGEDIISLAKEVIQIIETKEYEKVQPKGGVMDGQALAADKGADKAILGPMPENEAGAKKARRPSGLPPYLASLYEMPLLNREQEGHLFRKYNFLKFKADKLRKELDPAQPKSSLMDEIESLHQQAVALKNEIARANLRLVVSIAKRHVTPDQNFFELVSDGNMSLLRAIEKFDFARGNKFSTYASWAIMKNFARTIPGEFKHRDRFRTSQDELFAATQEHRGNPLVEEGQQNQREAQIERILRRLDEREQKIIIGRFGLDHAQEPQTLKEVGASLGVTKERIRQIEARALSKLRQAAQEEKILLDTL